VAYNLYRTTLGCFTEELYDKNVISKLKCIQFTFCIQEFARPVPRRIKGIHDIFTDFTSKQWSFIQQSFRGKSVM